MGSSPRYSDVQVGDKLPRRVVGPHSTVSIANECRAFRQNIWGTWRWNPPEGVRDPAKEDAGFGEDMSYDHEASKIDPRMHDGLYHGPSSGHINPEKAENVGMGGAYGYGASMNAWHLDTIAYWAGLDGYIWHSKTQFRSPAFEGDVTYIDAEVIEKLDISEFDRPIVRVELKMATQESEQILKGIADVEFARLSTALSLIHGGPLESEMGQGAHSIPAYLEEVCAKYGPAEAVIMRGAQGRVCWSYDDLHRQSTLVARSLIAGGFPKDARIGILMANRPEYLSSLFGIAMAGCVTVALSTFSTRDELAHLLAVSELDLLLFDGRVLKQDFAGMLKEIGPSVRLVQLDSVTDAATCRRRF